MPTHPPRGLFRTTCRNLLPLALSLVLCAGLLILPARPSAAQVVVTSGVRVSQIYAHGGEPGAAFQHDFIEIFNGGPSAIDINGWTLSMWSFNGNVTTVGSVGIFSLGGSTTIQPGRYFLIKLGGGTEGQPLPAADLDLSSIGGFLNLSAAGQIALLRRDRTNLPAFGCPQLPADGVEDYVGFGAVSCREGNGPAPAPTLTQSIKRGAGGCTDTDNNASDFTLEPAAPRNGQTPAAACVFPPERNTIQFAAPQYFASEVDGRTQVVVSRTGDFSTPAAVDYFTADGTALERRDYTTAAGTLRFAAGEQTKSFDVLVNEDAYAEGDETVNLVLLNAAGAVLGTPAHAQLTIHDGPIFMPPPSGNPADATAFFVRQHYHDFLSREPDADGIGFWSQGIESCGADAECRRVKRVDTSAAFFLSIEFQQTGYFVYRLYRASLPPRELRPRGMPRYREFLRDTQEIGRGVIVGQGDWMAQLNANRRAFLEAFVARPEFQEHYPASLTPAEYVQQLNLRAGGVLSLEELTTLIAGLAVGAETRATVLGRVADDEDFLQREFNSAFVLMQYFGYLRRDPDSTPDTGFEGFDFWLAKLNEHGDFRRAEMVRSFIESIEYRQRFGQ